MHLTSPKDFIDQSWIEDSLAIDPIVQPDGTHVMYDSITDAELETLFVPDIRDTNEVSSEALTKILSLIKWLDQNETADLRVAARAFNTAIHRQDSLTFKLEYLRESYLDPIDNKEHKHDHSNFVCKLTAKVVCAKMRSKLNAKIFAKTHATV